MNHPMTTGEAMEIVNQYGFRIGAVSFMECIESMDSNLFQLTVTERTAYRIAVQEMDAMAAAM